MYYILYRRGFIIVQLFRPWLRHNGLQNPISVLHCMVNNNAYVRIDPCKNYEFLESMCGFLHISKEMLIEKWRLVVHVHKSTKRTIQSGISRPQKWATISIHNAVNMVKKMHKRNWGHNLHQGNLKSSHWLQNRCQFLKHISSHVKIRITYYHSYHIWPIYVFLHSSVITGIVWLYMDEVKLHIHVIYILWLNLFYIFYSRTFCIPYRFCLCRTIAVLEANVICWL